MSSSRNYWTTSEAPPARGGKASGRARGRRWLLDGVGVVASLVLIAGALLYFRTHQEREALLERTTAELRRVELELKYRAAAKLGGLNGAGWPERVEEDWFRGPSGIPRNPLVSPERPWVDIAGPDEVALDHPTVKMTADPRLAGFWYNPNLGVVRARVPVLVSDEETLQVYNRVNGTRLASIFGSGTHAHDPESAQAGEEGEAPEESALEITTTGQVRRRSRE